MLSLAFAVLVPPWALLDLLVFDPALGWRLNDEEVAGVLSFVRSAWGNQAAGVTPGQVAKVRATLAPPGAGAWATGRCG